MKGLVRLVMKFDASALPNPEDIGQLNTAIEEVLDAMLDNTTSGALWVTDLYQELDSIELEGDHN